MKRWCRTTWQMKCCSHPNIFDLVLEKEMQLSTCWISLFSVLKMIIPSRQTWKEGDYFTFLIFLGTNNLFGKWYLFNVVFVLRILQIGNRNKAILTIAIKRKESDNDENIFRKYFSPKEKNHSEICLGLVVGCGLCYLGQRIRSKHLNIFFLSEIIEKVMQNNLTNEMLLTSKYIWPCPWKRNADRSCWISLFSVLKKMIIFSRQIWK